MPEAPPSPLAVWESFYVILGSAAAVLTGLVFVVVTLVADERQRRPPETLERGIAAFSTPTVVHFCVVLVLAAILSAPWSDLASAAFFLGLTGIGGVGYTAVVARRLHRQFSYRPVWEDWLWYALAPLVAYFILCVLAIALPRSPRRVLFGVGAAAVALLLIGLRNVWDTLTYIAVQRHDEPPPAPCAVPAVPERSASMREPRPEPAVQHHYTAADLEALILGAVAPPEAGGRLQVDDLAALDQLHAGGKPATTALARLAGLRAGMSVLDVGGGLGGPARTLAAEFGCTVCVLDLTAAFCRVGVGLTERAGLGERVRFVHGSALALPLRDAAFDVVWTQHSTMNIADKERLYAEAYRVLRPGGLLVFHEVLAGSGGPPYYPAPWADDPSISFLSPPDEVRTVLTRLGFVERAWVDVTATAVEEMRRARPASGPPHLLVLTRGPEAGTAILRNFRRSVEEGRVAVIQAVFERA